MELFLFFFHCVKVTKTCVLLVAVQRSDVRPTLCDVMMMYSQDLYMKNLPSPLFLFFPFPPSVPLLTSPFPFSLLPHPPSPPFLFLPFSFPRPLLLSIFHLSSPSHFLSFQQVKYNQYWPSHGTTAYGSLQVTLKNVDNFPEHRIRTFNISLVHCCLDTCCRKIPTKLCSIHKLVSFSGFCTEEEEREPGTHCSHMHQVPLITCIIFRYAKINGYFYLPAARPHYWIILLVRHLRAVLKSETMLLLQ